MKRSTLLFTALAIALWAVPVFAQGKSATAPGHAGGGGMGHGSSMGASPKTSGGSTGGGGGHSNVISPTNLPKPLQTDTKLAQKLEGILGISGTSALSTLQADAAGFKRLGQFVSTVHVFNNLDIKDKAMCSGLTSSVCFMNFATAVKGTSLGAAIKSFDPGANSSAEAKKGTKQANDDMKGS